MGRQLRNLSRMSLGEKEEQYSTNKGHDLMKFAGEKAEGCCRE